MSGHRHIDRTSADAINARADSLRLAADELEQAHRAGEEIDVPWWWLRDRADQVATERDPFDPPAGWVLYDADGRQIPEAERANAIRAAIPSASRREVTPEELTAALQAVDPDAGEDRTTFDYDWPYIDERCIDGKLSPVVEWLCANYAITPRNP